MSKRAAESAVAIPAPLPTLRQRADAELEEARQQLPVVEEEFRVAGAAFERAQQERQAFAVRFAPVIAHVESSGGALAPLIGAERKAIEERFETTRSAWAKAEGRQLAATRRVAAAELADAQLRLVGE